MENELWLGSLSLYQDLTSKKEMYSAALLAGSFTGSDEEPEDSSENFTLFDNVAVIDITGGLTNDDSWWTKYSGDTSYNQIRRALVESATHSDVQAILLNIDSGGGTPNGLSDIGDMIREISASGIPVHTYSGGTMASAAYWLGAAGVKVHAASNASVGSIGLISIHKEYTEMFKKDGIKVSVFRAGEEKALNNPYEKLSDKAKENLQSDLDTLYGVFIDYVADYRNKSPEYVREYMADGRVFIGQNALDVGLIDSITSLDKLIMSLQFTIDKQTALSENPMARKGTTHVLSAQQQAAMLEGATIDPVLVEVAPETTLEDKPAETTEALVDTTLALQGTAILETELTTFLRTELATKTAEILTLNTQLRAVTTEADKLKAVHEPMKQLVANSIGRMQVGLGAPMMDLSDMPAEILLSQHAKVTVLFCAQYPIGGVAAIAADDTTLEASPGMTAQDEARLRQAML